MIGHALKRAAQLEVVAALALLGDDVMARRLSWCMEARVGRRHGAPWPHRLCRSAGCSWCGRSLVMRWWRGLKQWIMEMGEQITLVEIPLGQDGDLRTQVRRLRRRLRDLRDRHARCSGFHRWRSVAFAGLVSANNRALIMVSHKDITRRELHALLEQHLGPVSLSDLGEATPSTMFPASVASSIAHARRGVEPLRVIILPQRLFTHDTSRYLDPLPVVF